MDYEMVGGSAQKDHAHWICYCQTAGPKGEKRGRAAWVAGCFQTNEITPNAHGEMSWRSA